jgi:2-methylcitrate dehydratase PrpD
MQVDTTALTLARFVHELSAKDIPERTFERARLNLLDTIASAAGGFPTGNAHQMREAGQAAFGSGNAPIWFSAQTQHPAAALLANCAAASALDIDDGHRGAAGHPGAAIIPAVLQEAARQGRSGHDMLAAIIIGYEIACRVASARHSGSVRTYSSGRWTGYGVAAALGWLRGLAPETLVNAMTIAGVEAPENLPAGSYRRLSSVKGSSPWSTLTAMVAVERAVAGADGPEDALDRSDVYDVPRMTTGLGASWEIEATYLKRYASCRYTHASIDALLAVLGERGVASHRIGSLVVEVFPAALTITNERSPSTLEGAQFSIPFCAALAALRGTSAFQPIRLESLSDPEVIALSDRIEIRSTSDFAHSFPASTPSRIRIELDGSRRELTVVHPIGDVENPMSRIQVIQKLEQLGNGSSSHRSLAQVVAEISELSADHLASSLLNAFG